MGMSMKRPFQLMLNDSPSPPKIAKSTANNIAIAAATKSAALNGPTIHELASEGSGNQPVELEDCVDDEEFM